VDRGLRMLIMLRVRSLCFSILWKILIGIALRAMKEAAFTWGDVHERYLSAATHFADDFKGWTGFGSMEEEM